MINSLSVSKRKFDTCLSIKNRGELNHFLIRLVILLMMFPITGVSLGQQKQGTIQTGLTIPEISQGNLEVPPEFTLPNPDCIEITKIRTYVFDMYITVHLATNIAHFFLGLDPVIPPNGHLEFIDAKGRIHRMRIAFAILEWDKPPPNVRGKHWIPGHQLRHISKKFNQSGTFKWKIYLMVHTNASLPPGNYQGTYSVYVKSNKKKNMLGSFGVCVNFIPHKPKKK